MSVRWRNYGRGELICGAKSESFEDDTYIDDALHYKLAVELRVLIPDINEKDNGLWYWIDSDKISRMPCNAPRIAYNE